MSTIPHAPFWARDPEPMSETRPHPTGTAFTCPRCGSETTDEYYGPCTDCRQILRAEQGGEARSVTTADYEPKMNVTPNAVATKD